MDAESFGTGFPCGEQSALNQSPPGGERRFPVGRCVDRVRDLDWLLAQAGEPSGHRFRVAGGEYASVRQISKFRGDGSIRWADKNDWAGECHRQAEFAW